MPANTPTYSFPYPVGTDFVKDGPTAIQDLAQAVEDTIEVLPTRVADLIINGSMRVAQRGTTLAGVTATRYTNIDRWYLEFGTTSGTWTITQKQTDLPPGASVATRIECTTARSPATTNYLVFLQRIEETNCAGLSKGTASALQLTVNFWVKSNLIGTYILELYDVANNRRISKAFTIHADSVWEEKTVTFAADTTGGLLTFGTTTGLEVRFWLQAGASYTSGALNQVWNTNPSLSTRANGQVQLGGSTGHFIEFTNVQAIPGGFKKDFIQRPVGETLTECQRYYYRLQDGVTGTDLITGRNASTTLGLYVVPFSVPMRVAPTTLDQSGTAAHYSIQHGTTNTVCSAVPALLTSTTRTGAVQFQVAAGLTAGQASAARFSNVAAVLAWSAEL